MALLNSTVVQGDLAVVGTCSANAFATNSDVRLKENFKEFESKESILSLPIYIYDYKDGPQNQLGCKAQDLQEICPEIVEKGPDGYLRIQESKIVYLLLDEIKRLNKKIEELETKIK